MTHDNRTVERFWSHVDKTGECWDWTASIRRNGYGQINVAGRNMSAHRLAWEIANGPIPSGLLVDHICRNRACVNPAHLRLATKKQNGENLGSEGRGASGVRGVKWDASRNAWAAAITHNYRSINLGRFSTIGEAAAAVREARRTYFTHSEPKEMSA